MTRNNRLLLIIVCAVALVLAAIQAGHARRSPHTLEPIVLYETVAHPYCAAVGEGAMAFARDSGVPVRIMVGQESTQANTNTNVESLATVGHRAFAIYPIDPAGSKGLFSQLTRGGSHVVAYGAEPGSGSDISYGVATNTHRAATMAAEKLVALLNGHGRILNVLEMLTDANTTIRRTAIEAVIRRYPKMSITQTIGDVATEQKSREKIESVLVARGAEIDGVICTGYTTTVAAAVLLSEHHRRPGAKRIRFVGLDTDDRVLEAIRLGAIDATIAQNPFGHGYISCAILDLLIKGWQPKSGYQLIDSGCVLVIRDNVDSFQDDIRAMTERISRDLKTAYLAPPAKDGPDSPR